MAKAPLRKQIAGVMALALVGAWFCGCAPSYEVVKRKQIERYPQISPTVAAKHMSSSMQKLHERLASHHDPHPDRDREDWLQMIGEMLPLLRSLSAYNLQQWREDLNHLKGRYHKRFQRLPSDMHRQIREMDTVAKRRITLARSKAENSKKLASLAIEQAIEEINGVSEKSLRGSKKPKKLVTHASKGRYPSIGFLYPLPGHRIGSGYGWRKRPKGLRYGKHRKWSFHTGVDMGAKTGTPILAAESGTVIRARWMGACGYGVIIRHPVKRYRRLTTTYCHMSRILVKEKQIVERGDKIGKIGSTGNSTGPHLHFAVHINGKHVNPKHHLLPDRPMLVRNR
jgi:murein DD-endopeptidase MepM/ murein hydrolase activator NlpD